MAFDDDSLYLSVLTAGEITRGIELLPEGRRRRELTAWLARLTEDFSERLLPVDRETGQIWGSLTASATRDGQTLPAVDGLIAATAKRSGLTVATRNTAHFLRAGVEVYNPWE